MATWWVTGEKQSYDLTLTRAVAMVRLVLTDERVPTLTVNGSAGLVETPGGNEEVHTSAPGATAVRFAPGASTPRSSSSFSPGRIPVNTIGMSL